MGSLERVQRSAPAEQFQEGERPVWTARIEECPVCHKGVAVRPLTGGFWRHGAGVCCPGSDKTMEELVRVV